MLIRYRPGISAVLVWVAQTALALTITGCDDSRPGQPVPANPSDNASVQEVADRLEGSSPDSAGLHSPQPTSPAREGGAPSQADLDLAEAGEAPSPRAKPGISMEASGMPGGGGMGMPGKSGGMGMHGGGGMGMPGKSGGMGMHGGGGMGMPGKSGMGMPGKSGGMGMHGKGGGMGMHGQGGYESRGGMMGDDKTGSPSMDMDEMADDPNADSPNMGSMTGMPDNPPSTPRETSSADENTTEPVELAELLPESAGLLKSGGARFFLDAALMLELSSAQQSALEEIAREHAVADERLRVRVAARESDLAQALDTADYDHDAVADIIEAVEKLRRRRRTAYLDALTEARDILTRRQRQRLAARSESVESEDESSKRGDAKGHGKKDRGKGGHGG